MGPYISEESPYCWDKGIKDQKLRKQTGSDPFNLPIRRKTGYVLFQSISVSFERCPSFVFVPNLAVLVVIVASAVASFSVGCATKFIFYGSLQNPVFSTPSFLGSHNGPRRPHNSGNTQKRRSIVSYTHPYVPLPAIRHTSPFYEQSKYYESLVHPALLLTNDKCLHQRIAVLDVSAGNSAANGRGITHVLHEIQKHKGVSSIDLHHVYGGRNPGGRTTEVVKGGGIEVYYHENAHSFIDYFASRQDSHNDGFYDVVIFFHSQGGNDLVDSLIVNQQEPKFDTSMNVSNGLLPFVCSSILSKGWGVLLLPIGDSPSSKGYISRAMTRRQTQAIRTLGLHEDWFHSIHVYDEVLGSTIQSFVVAYRNAKSRTFWYLNEALKAYEIRKRLLASATLHHIDGFSLQRYQRPSKAWESLVCNGASLNSTLPRYKECTTMKGFDPTIPNAPAEMFDVKLSPMGEYAGRGVFANVDVPKGTYVMQERGVSSVQFPPPTMSLIEALHGKYGGLTSELSSVVTYMYGYGYESDVLGGIGTFVDSSISTFTNHGCNGTYTSIAVNHWLKEERKEYYSEWTADETAFPWAESGFVKMFNPVIDRHLEAVWTKNQLTRRDIRAGEEITENYLFFSQRDSEWADEIQDLRQMCVGRKGVVAEREIRDS